MGQLQDDRCCGNGGKQMAKKFDYTASFFEVSIVV